MSYKETCPGCGAHLSSIAEAFGRDEPCPECGLSAAAAAEIATIRESRADAALKARCEELTLKVGNLGAENTDLRRRLHDVLDAVDGWQP